jgi:transcriptional regulator with XRE-family HTH domain
MNFKAVIQGWLRERGMLQGQLAHRLDITPQTLSDMLSRGNPTLTTLHRFARVMEVSLTLFEEGEKHEGMVEP